MPRQASVILAARLRRRGRVLVVHRDGGNVWQSSGVNTALLSVA